MIQQLVKRIVDAGATREDASLRVLTADPMDLVLYMEQVWDAANLLPWTAGPAGVVPARTALRRTGAFSTVAPAGNPAWDHLGYAYVLENTRAVQILQRVVREYRSGEALGVPSAETQRWLDATEALLFGAANLFPAWLSTSVVRADPEAVRRNAYWRMFGMDLAFGTEDNRPAAYSRAAAANTTFVPLFEELLHELWQAMANIQNTSGVNQADNDRIFRIAQQLAFILNVRRQKNLLSREELAAVTVLGWIELTLSTDTPVVVDLGARATNAADRLKLIGQKVGLAPHSRAVAFFAMSQEISLLLRALEAQVVTGAGTAWVLYAQNPPVGGGAGVQPIGEQSRRVITEWSAASGKDLKIRKVAVQTTAAPPAVRPDGRQPALTGR